MKLIGFARLTTVIIASVLYAGVVSSQETRVASSDLRTKAIVASFNKSKHVVREKRGVRKEKYLDVRSVPAVKQNPADYSGAYEDLSGMGFSLTLRVSPNGLVEGTGYEPLNGEPAVSRSFTLRNGRITGALITATKVYGNGSTEPLEGVFINKTVFESATDKGVTAFGLGVIGRGLQINGLTVDKLFYQLKR
jgi:hypothetical protein